jgi:hypothetical protein
MKIKHTPIPLSLSLSLSLSLTCRHHRHLSLKLLIANFCNSGIFRPIQEKLHQTHYYADISFATREGGNSLKGRKEGA